jgi:hypothetical protein
MCQNSHIHPFIVQMKSAVYSASVAVLKGGVAVLKGGVTQARTCGEHLMAVGTEVISFITRLYDTDRRPYRRLVLFCG